MRRAAETGQFDFAGAVDAEVTAQDRNLIAGIAAYRRHAWRRDLPVPPTIWTEGSARILDYGTGPNGQPVLFVPSLINRAYVFDLRQGGSAMRWLAAHGVRPLLLDWGAPTEAERAFTLTDYVAGRLERALIATNRALGRGPVLAGYCMGGLLAVAAAQRRPDLVNGLVLLAVPWDFHSPDASRARMTAQTLGFLEPLLDLHGVLPVDFLQALFALLDPWSIGEKYRRFALMDHDGEAALSFVAMEDWLNDGVPLAAPVARACLSEWYGENAPARLQWRIAGDVVDPGQVMQSAFVAIPSRDRLVPPESARALAACLPHAMVHEPHAGHIGMVAGPRAATQLWRPLLGWLQGLC